MEELLLLFRDERCEGAASRLELKVAPTLLVGDTSGEAGLSSSQGLRGVRLADGGGLSPGERSDSVSTEKLSINAST